MTKPLVDVLANCEGCQAEFRLRLAQRYRQRRGQTRFYCGRACAESSRERLSRRAADTPNAATCKGCQQPFSLSASQRGRYRKGVRNFYCSLPCFGEEVVRRTERQCSWCGETKEISGFYTPFSSWCADCSRRYIKQRHADLTDTYVRGVLAVGSTKPPRGGMARRPHRGQARPTPHLPRN